MTIGLMAAGTGYLVTRVLERQRRQRRYSELDADDARFEPSRSAQSRPGSAGVKPGVESGGVYAGAMARGTGFQDSPGSAGSRSSSGL